MCSIMLTVLVILLSYIPILPVFLSILMDNIFRRSFSSSSNLYPEHIIESREVAWHTIFIHNLRAAGNRSRVVRILYYPYSLYPYAIQLLQLLYRERIWKTFSTDLVRRHNAHAYRNVLQRRFFILNKLKTHIADKTQFLIVLGSI